MNNNEFAKIAVNVYVVRDGKLLLGKRKKPTLDSGWGLPGGHVEYMEHLVDAAKRELEEETGLKADLLFSNVVNMPLSNGTHYVHVNFVASNVVGEPELKEPDKCFEWKWFSFNELPQDIFIGHQKAIPAFLNGVVFME